METGIYRGCRNSIHISADFVVSLDQRSPLGCFINMCCWFRGILNIILFEEQQIMSERTIKNKLKVFRAMHDWTQEELARRVSVTRKTINTVEKGKYIPSTYLALKLAKVFQVPVEDLFQLDSEFIPKE
jgi:putative transcriptional regulator